MTCNPRPAICKLDPPTSPPFLSVTNITRAQVTPVIKADGSRQNKMVDVYEVPESFASNPSLSEAMIFPGMNAIFACAYRSLKISGLQRGLNP